MVRLSILSKFAITPTVEENSHENSSEADDQFDEDASFRGPPPGHAALKRILDRRRRQAEEEEKDSSDHESELRGATTFSERGDEKEEVSKEKKRVGILKPVVGFFVVNLVVAPLLCVLIGGLIGFAIDYIETEPWGTAFWHATMRLAAAPPVTEFSPKTKVGDNIDTGLSVLSLIFSCIIISMSSMMGIVKDIALFLKPNTRRRMALMFFIAFPFLVLMLCVILGCLLGGMEGKSVRTGFYYCASLICGGGFPITNFKPKNWHSRTFILLTALTSKGAIGVVVGCTIMMPPFISFMHSLDDVFSDYVEVDVLSPAEIRRLEHEEIYFGGGHGRRGSFGTVYSNSGP